ncbi:MAG TPA: ABC transporter ATP-binding protein [Xanthobacteraceae bacterium]|nr:ABC transporter ATP-binding protein [Xanthobacteraceae bacterium]
MSKSSSQKRWTALFGEDAREIIPRLFATDGRKHAWGYALSFVFMAIIAATTALAAYMMKHVVDRIFVDGNYAMVWILGGTLAGLFALKGAATYGQMVTLAKIGNRIIADYQRKIYDSLLAQGVSFFAERHSTEFLNRMNAGAGGARMVLDLIITSVGRDFVTLVGLVIVMAVQDPIMMVFGMVTMPPAVYVVRILSRRTRQNIARQFTGTGELMKTLQETVQGVRIVKSYNLEDDMRARMNRTVTDVERVMNKIASLKARSSPLMETLGGFAIAGFVIYAGHGVLAAGQMPGEFFSVVTALLLAYEPAKRLARLHIDLSASLTQARFMFDLLDSMPVEQDDASRPALNVASGKIEFKDVAFRYRPTEPVLRGISFAANPGQTLALVGSSGSGKSTIMNLAIRFWDPQAGKILIDDQDVSQVSRRSLRNAIGYVSQDVYLFSGTIRDNIAMGKQGATEAEIFSAARAAFAHDFITAFPQGYDSPVGEHGVQVSGGQRARIAIARAFLKNAPILLLDEPTAALDSESEREVQRALDALRSSRTTLVIAHRLQTIISADQICVVDNGRIVESGTHQELLARRGRYHQLYETQFDDRRAASA